MQLLSAAASLTREKGRADELRVRNYRLSRETGPPTLEELVAMIRENPDPQTEEEDAPLVVLVNLLLYEAAVELEATRVRIDAVDASHCTVRCMVGDEEQILIEPPARLRAPLVERIQFMAMMGADNVPAVGFLNIIFGELPQMMLNVEVFRGSDGNPSVLVHILVHSIKAALAKDG